MLRFRFVKRTFIAIYVNKTNFGNEKFLFFHQTILILYYCAIVTKKKKEKKKKTNASTMNINTYMIFIDFHILRILHTIWILQTILFRTFITFVFVLSILGVRLFIQLGPNGSNIRQAEVKQPQSIISQASILSGTVFNIYHTRKMIIFNILLHVRLR